MKATKIVLGFASLLLLASCGGNQPAQSSHPTGLSTPADSSSAAATSSEASSAGTMSFLQNGKFFASVPQDVVTPVEARAPKIKVNGIDINGSRTFDIDNKFTLEAEGTFWKDLYITIASFDAAGHMAVYVYGAIEKEHLNDAFPNITSAVGVPSKLFIAFSTAKANWPKGYDTAMDQQIQDAWDLVG